MIGSSRVDVEGMLVLVFAIVVANALLLLVLLLVFAIVSVNLLDGKETARCQQV